MYNSTTSTCVQQLPTNLILYECRNILEHTIYYIYVFQYFHTTYMDFVSAYNTPAICMYIQYIHKYMNHEPTSQLSTSGMSGYQVN